MIMNCGSFQSTSETHGLITEAETEIVIVPIDQEPNHKCVLENESLRVFDVCFLPGEVSLYHRHEADSVLICIEGANVTSEEPGKAFVSRPPIPSRDIYYRPYSQCPLTHRVRNIDSVPFRILDVEVLSTQHCPTSLAPLPTDFKVTLDNDRVRLSCVQLNPGQTTGVISLAGPRLWVAFDAGKLDISSATGGWSKIIDMVSGPLHAEQGDANEVITNVSQGTVALILTEIKQRR